MSLWTRISEALAALTKGEGLSTVFDKLRAPPDRTVAFTIAVIALGAKMAKADGVVTRDEVTAFREVFVIARDDEAKAAHVFNLARQDVAGFEIYAQRIRAMYGTETAPLADLIAGLFYIAMADGRYHPNEDAFLGQVAAIFGFADKDFRRIRAQFVPDAERDPYEVLGLPDDATPDEVRRAWRQAVRESHPDQIIARGLPEEAIKLAEKQMIAINRAWEQINQGKS